MTNVDELESEAEPTPKTGTVLVCAATVWEARPLAARLRLRKASESRFEGLVAARPVVLVKTGAGPAAASAFLSQLGSAEDYACVLSTGLAGALQPGMNCGDMVIDIQGAESTLPPVARAIAQWISVPLHFGRIIHSDVVVPPAQKRALGEAKRASAVDMESSSIRDWASRRGVPSLAARVVLDGLDDRVPETMPKGEGVGDLIQHVLSNPAGLPLMMATGLRSRRAIANLGEFLERFLPVL